jgi:LysR family nitrogen assimilation transcriptional regulator
VDSKLLHNFMVIVDCGSLSKASERLHVAQPALSYQLSVLEGLLEQKLLDRSTKGVTPTNAGAILYRRASAILQQVDGLRDAVRFGDVAECGPVAIGFPSSTVGLLCRPLIERVLARHPAIQLRIFESMSGYVADRLAGGQLDLAMLFRDSPTLGVAVTPLLDEDLLLMGDAGLGDLPGDAPCPLVRLGQVPMVLPSDAQGLRVLVERYLIKEGVTLKVVAEIDSLSTLVGVVRAGLACTILSRSALVAHGGEGDLTIRPLAVPSGIRRPVSLCWSTNLPRTPASIAVQRSLVALVCELVQQGAWSGASLRPGVADQAI